MIRQETDVVIIGAGPVGLFAVFQCGMVGLKCHVIDALDMVGGQCMALYPEKPIYDIPAHPMITGEALIENLKAQAAPFAPAYHLGQQVTHLEKQGAQWLVKTSKGAEILTKAVIIAAGVGAFGPNRPPLQGLERFEGTSVLYMVRSREEFRGKKLVIAGGGDSALDWAISLSELAEKIYVVHRRDKFRAAPDSVSKLNELNGKGVVEIITPYQLQGLEGEEDGTLRAIHLHTLEGESKRLEADYLLAFFGLSMNLGPIAEWGLNLDKKLIAVDPTTCETNHENVYAIGDIATYDNKLKLILCGFSEAALAAHKIRARLFPDQTFHFEYSTTKGVPGSGTGSQEAA